MPIPGSARTSSVAPAAPAAMPSSSARKRAISASRPISGWSVAASIAQRAQLPHRNVVRKAANRHRTGLVRLDEGRARAVDVVGDHGLARARDRVQPGGQVDGVARHRVGAVNGAARVGGHHLAARDADVGGKRAPELGRQRAHGRVYARRGAQRPQRVVAVRDRRAEHAHDRVADVLVDRAAALRDQAVDQLEIAREQPVHVLGVEFARQLRVPREVGEQHGDLPALAGRPRRGVRGGVPDASAAPHCGQKRASAERAAWQRGHEVAAGGIAR